MNRSALVLGVLSVLPLATRGDETAASGPPLPERIDRLIASSHCGPTAALSGDAEFLRRVSLDLTGMPPGPEELRAYLAEDGPEKRAKLVDRLLESPLYGRRLAEAFDVMWMERRTTQNVSGDDWQNYLIKAFRENRPLNQVIKEILSADGADANLRSPARFYLDRGSEPNLITRDVGRLFFGRDLQCAQCHNHPMIEDYRQSDYQGLLAFFLPGYALTRKEGTKSQTFYAEKAGDELTFDSVFVKDDKHRTGARLPGGTEIAEPLFPPGEEYQVKPADNVLPVPRFSRRAELAKRATGGANRAFNENIANRLWALVMGRGLVHPVDLQHPANPPSHPELLAVLTDELVRVNYDTRAFLRALVLTRTYQRSIDLPLDPAQTGDAESSAAPPAALESESESESDTAALEAASKAAEDEYRSTLKAWHAAEAALFPAAAEQDLALAKHSEAAKKQAEAQKAVDAARAQLAARRDVAKTLSEAADKAQDAVKKLAGEIELAAAALKFVDRSRAMTAELAALEKTSADRSAGLEKAAGDVAAARELVEAARAKARPLREAIREREQRVLAAREKKADAQVALGHHKLRLEWLETDAQRRSLETQAAEAEAAAARAADTSKLEALRSELAAVQEQQAAQLTERFAVAQLRPLSPEQMCWSMLKVTGVYDRTRQAEETEWNKAKPLTEQARNDAAAMRARACAIEDRTFEKLKKNLAAFVRVYAAAPGQPQADFFATADQALFAAYDGLINGWIAPAGGNVSERMIGETDPAQAALDLYQTVLARLPTAEESADVVRILNEGAANKPAAAQELVWGLLTSAEFRFNH
jgi:hypothetical protein